MTTAREPSIYGSWYPNLVKTFQKLFKFFSKTNKNLKDIFRAFVVTSTQNHRIINPTSEIQHLGEARVNSAPDVNEKTEAFTEEVTQALNEFAPYKRFKIRTSFKPGLSEKAKALMRERDKARKAIPTARSIDKLEMTAKYKFRLLKISSSCFSL